MATVQLVHRAFFWALSILIPILWWRTRDTAAGNALLAAFILQAALGITTLLLGVPVGLGAAHQGGAAPRRGAMVGAFGAAAAALPCPPCPRLSGGFGSLQDWDWACLLYTSDAADERSSVD